MTVCLQVSLACLMVTPRRCSMRYCSLQCMAVEVCLSIMLSLALTDPIRYTAKHPRTTCWLPQVQTVLSNHIVSIVPAAAIGLVCGGLSIVFTVLNLKVARLRQKYIGV